MGEEKKENEEKENDVFFDKKKGKLIIKDLGNKTADKIGRNVNNNNNILLPNVKTIEPAMITQNKTKNLLNKLN